MKISYLIFLCLISSLIQAQGIFVDSLSTKSDKELFRLFIEAKPDSVKAKKIMEVCLNRAQKEKDTIKIVKAYLELITINNFENGLIISDSIIYFANRTNNNDFLSRGYYQKGLIYGRMGELKKATESHTGAYKLALKNKNIVQQVFISNRLILLKSVWGNKREALDLQKKRDKLIRSEEYIAELRAKYVDDEELFNSKYTLKKMFSLANFVVCYSELKVIDSVFIYIDKGLQETAEYNDQIQVKNYYYKWFKNASAENYYNSKKYKKAIATLNKLMDTLTTAAINKDILIKDAYYFKGLSFIKLGQYRKGIKNLRRADSIFDTEDILAIYPYHRKLFEELMTYYGSRGNIKLKKKYTEKLKIIDSIFQKNYNFFEPNLIRNYETPQLLEKKEDVITELKQKNKKSSTKIWWMFGFLMISLVTISYYFKRQQLFKKRFDELMSKQELPKDDKVKVIISSEQEKTDVNNNGVAPEIEVEILSHLDDFELKKGYLSQNVSLQKMAKNFGTNYNYLSKVINFNKGKNLSKYINDLRIEYSFEELKSNIKLRKYTVKALAKEFGFSNAESFSKKFYKKYGIYPSYYIKNLEKQKLEENKTL